MMVGFLCMTVAACGDDTDGETSTSTPTGTSTGTGGQGGGGQGGNGGSPAGADWSCLPNPQGNPPSGATLDLPLKFVGYQGMAPLAGLDITVCQMADTDCANPVTQGTSDANGEVTVELPMGTTGFVGYGEITGGNILPTIGMANVPIVTERTEPVQIVLVTQAELSLLVTFLGGTLDMDAGHMSVYAWDCAQQLASGATVHVDSPAGGSDVFYFDDSGQPVPSATETAAFGLAGAYNIPAGPLELSATVAETGDPMGTATSFTRAGWLTSIVLLPTPQ
jgi:hypothetical protein